MWTLFWYRHFGGCTKEEPYEKIYIESPKKEAEVIFFNRFCHNPNRVTCTCCGAEYSIDESETLEEACEYHRKNYWNELGQKKELSVEEYMNLPNVLVISANEIKSEERIGKLPEHGWVWV